MEGRLRYWIVYVSAVSLTTVVGTVWLLNKGPMPVVRGTTSLSVTVPFWYMVSAFPLLGMLVAELLRRLRTKQVLNGVILLGAISALVILSHLRLAYGVPLSGHALLMAYVVGRRLLPPTDGNALCRVELLIASLSLLVVTYVKLAMWQDPVTLTVGVGMGGTLCIVEKGILRAVSKRRTRVAD